MPDDPSFQIPYRKVMTQAEHNAEWLRRALLRASRVRAGWNPPTDFAQLRRKTNRTAHPTGGWGVGEARYLKTHPGESDE